ncbi:Argininosuccinate lyase [Delftia tsuruhatensis]|uniref:Bug family tripartite tricarboxylate transporter substrate binding protein n=1 Tax=Delftia tsuruhatensis TaxID=180282 RepID=UPI001E6E8A4D|nr:tripartite tricarboxylate transporter substrate binding protein [Delftia tsuruhatensis]CAB5674239.1 Argininosuccinate lyase [Delftia tsuruhatensis]CAC9683820.1 Argininosuccinate lyase [Delftia tsuruhatensis]
MHTRRNILQPGMALAAAAMAAALLGAPAAARAQGADSWPSRPIKLIVPYAAGGFADTRARKIADRLGQSLGQPIVIDNRGGAGGVTGTDAIAKASDGHTFGFGSPGPLVTNPLLMKKLPYNAARDLQPVILIEEAPLILTTAPNQPFKTVAELVAAAKARPGTLTYGSSGVGGAHHLSGELLAFQTRTDMVHVPYKGGALAATDLMGGHLAFMFEMGYAALPAIQGDKVKALAVSSRQRLKVLPDVPTLDEAGIKGFESYNWLGMIAPASTPPAVIERLNKAVNEALKDAQVRAMIEDTGGVVMGGTPQAYGKFIEAERAKWGPVIKNANITLD